MDLSKPKRRGLRSDGGVYMCGGCNFKSIHIRTLHLHLQDHPEGGSYYYNSHLKIAFPKYDTTCSAVQTDGLDNGEHKTSRTSLIVDEEFQTGNNYDENSAYGLIEEEGTPLDSYDNINGPDNLQNIIRNESLDLNDNGNLENIKICVNDNEKTIETNKIDKVKEVCKFCNKSYCNKFYLKRHIAKYHKRKIKTDLAPQVSHDNTALYKPNNVHSRKRKLYKKKCKVCKQSMPASNLILHMRCHNDEKPYKCHLCNKAFKIKSLLQYHLKIHEGKTNFLCQCCGKGSVTYKSYKNHRNTCLKLEKFVCEVCGAKYATKNGLVIHTRKHTGDKPFICQVCGFATTNESTLKVHIKFKHSHEKSYKCDECDKTFVLKKTLARHKRVHSKIRPHGCEHCDKIFSESWNLKAHMRQHTGDKPYKCINCGVGFAHNVVRKKHQSNCIATAEIVPRNISQDKTIDMI